jgi:uncharacterized protein YegL
VDIKNNKFYFMTRRLPVYLIIDTSGSMTGEPIEAIKNGLSTLVTALRSDPHALETAFLSVITFDSGARQVVPLTDLASFQEPSFTAQGSTSLGEALTLVSKSIDNDVKKSGPDQKGDWKPLVFIMTDGQPTDDWQKGLSKFKSSKTGMVVACAAGSAADTALLKQITENVVMLDTADKATISAYFKWVSSSITMSSIKLEKNNSETTSLNELPPPPPEVNVVF